MKLLIGSDGFALPLDAITQTFAILGIRGSGKTNTAVVLVEELLKQKQQVVVLDPVDVWWGLRGSAHKSVGFPITILGGEHRDLPLEVSAGGLIADFVVDNSASLILSLRHLSMSDQRKFAADFAERLYTRKGESKLRSPLHLVIDECDEFIPQRIPPGGERMFGAFDRIVRRGRAAGLGVTMISQRAQVVNKDVLSQIETLICHRVLHKLDRKALEAWIEAHDVDQKGDEFMSSLASLGRGETWIWSPEWLGVFRRANIRARETYDSSATPKAGERITSPKYFAVVDLSQLHEKMAGTIERSKAEDPRELRRQITELKKQLASKPTEASAGRMDKQLVQQRVKKAEELALARTKAHLQRFARACLLDCGKATSTLAVLQESLTVLSKEADGAVVFLAAHADARDLQVANLAKAANSALSAPGAPSVRGRHSGDALSKAERSILSAIAQFGECSKNKLALIAGYAGSGGGFNNALGSLRSKGFIEGSDPIRGLSAGIAAIGTIDPMPFGKDLLAYWQSRLSKAERTILEALSKSRTTLDKARLAELSGYEASGGGFNNALGRLRTLGLVSGSKEIALAEEPQ